MKNAPPPAIARTPAVRDLDRVGTVMSDRDGLMTATCRRLGVLGEHTRRARTAARRGAGPGGRAEVGAAAVGGSRATPAQVEQYVCDGYVVVHVGLGRIVALYYCSSTLHRNR